LERLIKRGSLEEANIGRAGLRCAYFCKDGAHRVDCQVPGDVPGQHRSVELTRSNTEVVHDEFSLARTWPSLLSPASRSYDRDPYIKACFRSGCRNYNDPKSVFCSAQCAADGLKEARAKSSSHGALDPTCHLCGAYDHVEFHCIFRSPQHWLGHARRMPTVARALRNLRQTLPNESSFE